MSTTAKTAKTYDGFTEAERAAMKDRAKELKARPRGVKVDTEAEVLAKLAQMPDTDRAVGERLHAIIKASAPSLIAKLWYGMPAYAKDGKIVCHFQPAGKFGTRYGMLCFSDVACLDDGVMWATSFAIAELTAASEKKVAALVKQAVR